MEFIWFAIFGLIIGALAKLLMPGRDPGGFIITAIIGMVGSLLGTFLGRQLLGYREGDRTGWTYWILSILGAIILLALYRMIIGRRTVA